MGLSRVCAPTTTAKECALSPAFSTWNMSSAPAGTGIVAGSILKSDSVTLTIAGGAAAA